MGGERLDTRNPTSKLMLTILAGVATWEREIMLERQRESIAKAKAAGKYKGRPHQHRRGADQATEGRVGSRGDRRASRHRPEVGSELRRFPYRPGALFRGMAEPHQAMESVLNRLHASPVLPSGQRLPQSGLHAARSASARSGVLLRHDLPQPRQLFARRDACRPDSEVVDGRDHLAGGHVAHRALHRMAVVIEADREQFVLIELIHR
jgi:hypothetical protein